MKSLQNGHTIKRTPYKADKDFSLNLQFSVQTLLNVISIKRTLPDSGHYFMVQMVYTLERLPCIGKSISKDKVYGSMPTLS